MKLLLLKIFKYIYIPNYIVNFFLIILENFIGFFKFTGEYYPKYFERKRNFKKLNREKINKINSKNAVLILTLQKSGTNYLLNLLSSYLKPDYQNKKITNIKETINFRNGIIWFDEELNSNFNFSSKENSYIFFQHIESAKKNAIFFKGKIIYLIRNPRDWLISFHEYSKSRKDFYYKPKTISRAIDKLMPIYCDLIKEIEYLIRDENDLLVHYEDLVDDPENTIKKIINFLSLEYNEKNLKHALNVSSIKNFKSIEQDKFNINEHKLNRESFIRNPEKSQWKLILKKKDIKRIDDYIRKNGINLNFKH